jgi:putative oxidoreductase
MKHWRGLALSNVEASAVALLRVVVGTIFVVHGAMKLSDVEGTARLFAVHGIPFPQSAVYLAIAGEFFGGLGLLVGFLARWAAVGTALTMVSAIVFVHAGRGLLSKNGGWEYPLTLLCASIFFMAHGAGVFSVDTLLRKLRDQKRRPVVPETAR